LCRWWMVELELEVEVAALLLELAAAQSAAI
jgi:hypothetical protein